MQLPLAKEKRAKVTLEYLHYDDGRDSAIDAEYVKEPCTTGDYQLHQRVLISWPGTSRKQILEMERERILSMASKLLLLAGKYFISRRRTTTTLSELIFHISGLPQS